mgnify:CR=1 FL=1
MKKFIFYVLVLSVMACGKKTASSSLNSAAIDIPMTADGKVDTLKLPKFTFQNDTYDFGKITQGEKVSYSFNFKNTGYVPLIISSASASCGCTVPTFPEELEEAARYWMTFLVFSVFPAPDSPLYGERVVSW